jgi:hypothetical protein
MLAELLDVSSCMLYPSLKQRTSYLPHSSIRSAPCSSRRSPSSLPGGQTRCYSHAVEDIAETGRKTSVSDRNAAPTSGNRAAPKARSRLPKANVGTHSSDAGTDRETGETAGQADCRPMAKHSPSSKWMRDRSGSQWARSVYRYSTYSGAGIFIGCTCSHADCILMEWIRHES